MVSEEIGKWVRVLKDITSTTAIIGMVLFMVYQNFGAHARAVEGARASAEEGVLVARAIKDAMSDHTKLTSEESSMLKMILIQICLNTAQGDRQAIQQCANYR